MNHPITVTVNQRVHQHSVEPRLLLVYFLRETLGLTGTHVGCDTTSCGACTILLDGQAVKSCTVLAVQADGSEILTVEGLARDGALHPIQEGFWEEHGLQCGFCTPGMMLTALQLLARTPDPRTGRFGMRSTGISAAAPDTSTSSTQFATRPANCGMRTRRRVNDPRRI